MDPETPEADAAEQSQHTVDSAEDDELDVPPVRDTDPADLADQHRSVPEEDPYDRG